MPPLIGAKAAQEALSGTPAGNSGFMVGRKRKDRPSTRLHVTDDGSARTGAVPGPGTGHRQMPRDYRYQRPGATGASPDAPGGKVKYRVGLLTLSSALVIAFIVDGLQFLCTFIEWIPGVMLIPMFLGVVGSGIITLIYSLKGVSYTSGKKAMQRFLAIFATAAIEAVPLVDDLPTLTADALFTAMSSWQEDRENHAENLKKQSAAARANRHAQEQAEAQFAARQAQASQERAEQEAETA